MNNKVTVLMPVFNGEKFLREAVDSILLQTFKDFEFLIIDDGCSDRSVEIVESYRDERIKLHHNGTNLGMISSLNTGLDLAQGEYIARMDCDDLSMPRRLEKQVKFMDDNPEVGVCGTWIRLFMGADGIKQYPVTHEGIMCNLLFECSLAHPSVMIRKDAVRNHGLYYSCNACEDYELWTRCSNVIRLANLPEVLVKYRIHFDQISTSENHLRDKKSFEVSVKHLSKLHKIPSEVETSLHRQFFPRHNAPNYIPTLEMLVKGHDWLSKLRSENAKEHIFPEPEFTRILAERWLFLCKAASHNGYRVLSIYLKSPLRKPYRQSFLQKGKMMIKCLLRIDRREMEKPKHAKS